MRVLLPPHYCLNHPELLRKARSYSRSCFPLVRGFCPRTRRGWGSAPFRASVSLSFSGQSPAAFGSEGRTLRPETRRLRPLDCGRSPRCVLFAATLAILSCPLLARSQTTLLVDFEQRLDAAFAAGDHKARVDPRTTPEHVRIVDGRFGKGVFVSADAPGVALSYDVEKHLDPERGTVELYFRPNWEWADAPKHVTLLSTYGGGGTGFRVLKNQYNWLGFWYALRYKTMARVITQYARQSKVMGPPRWVHIAVSWDEAEARLFIDGGLVSISDQWEVAGGQFHRLTLGCVAYGGGRGAGGTFDELRLSGTKKYVASFPPPIAPLTVEALTEHDDREPLIANSPKAAWESNRPVEIERDDRGRAVLRLRRRDDVDDVVYLPTAGGLSRFLGTLGLRARLAEPVQLPTVLFDATDIVFNYRRGRDRSRRTGWRLCLTSDARLQWQSLEDKSVVGHVQSEPLGLEAGEWHRFGVRWRASRVTLLYDGAEVASDVGQGLPSALPRYVYIGSQSTAQHTFDGWISDVEIGPE